MAPSPKALAVQLLAIINRDSDRMERIDEYLHGKQDDPYMPPKADDEYKLLAKRAVSNWMPLVVGTPAQALYVDGFRPSKSTGNGTDTPEWDHWQRSRMDARQAAVHRGALIYGHSYTLTEKTLKGVTTKGLSAMSTAALYEDAANDNTPYAALTVTRWPCSTEPIGVARMWDAKTEYAVTFKALNDADSVTVAKARAHGASECPITRFAAAVDLDGRTVGVIEPMIPLQNRINQTVFDLLVAQTYGSFKVRYVTGMAPPLKRDIDTGEPEVDANGNKIPLPIDHNVRRFLFAEDPDVKFGSLDETPLDGYINSIDMSIRHLSAISQIPPHHLLGQIANLSAEALQAAETALSRKVAEFRVSFGESWERVFRLAAELDGNIESANDFAGEVVWRDMESRSLSASADALGKMREQLGVPAKATWAMIPGVTQTMLDQWEEMAKEDDSEALLAGALHRATTPLASKPAA